MTDYEEAYRTASVVDSWESAPGKEVIVKAFEFFNIPGDVEVTVMDIGCGTGYLLNRLFELRPLNMYRGVDFSSSAIETGWKRYPHLQLWCEDGSRTGFESSSVDILISYGSFEHFLEYESGIAEAARLMKSGAVFLMMMPTLGVDRTDREDEGWYEERPIDNHPISQMQWNLRRETWEKVFEANGLRLSYTNFPEKFGAIKPGNFYFGYKA